MRVNNSRILWIKNEKFSGHRFYMNMNMQRDFQICISVPLKAHPYQQCWCRFSIRRILQGSKFCQQYNFPLILKLNLSNFSTKVCLIFLDSTLGVFYARKTNSYLTNLIFNFYLISTVETILKISGFSYELMPVETEYCKNFNFFIS